MPDESRETRSASGAARKSSARTYLLWLFLAAGLPGLIGGAVWWLYAQKRAVERAFTEPVREFKGHTGWIQSVAITPDGRRALSVHIANTCTLHLWDLETGKSVRKFEEHEVWITSVAVSPDGRRALLGSTSGTEGTFRLWDLDTGEIIREIEGRTDQVCSISFTPDGQRVLSGTWDGTPSLHSLPSGRMWASGT